MKLLVASLMGVTMTVPMFAQNFDPPPAKTPDQAILKQVQTQQKVLEEAVRNSSKALPVENQADLQVYPKAIEWITRHQEYFTADIGKQILAVLDQGIKRAEASKAGKPNWLNTPGKSVSRGYRSRVDDSVQPYAVWYPADYGTGQKKWRIDIMLHGRNSSLTEVNFLNSHHEKNTPKDHDFIQIDIYGRGNNAYRWAGESDVFEAFNHFVETESKLGRKDLLDLHRVVLKGFSMGGAGTWHIGLRRPDLFAAIQPGAGFTTTHGYIAGLQNPLPFPQEDLLKIYDAAEYAENAFNVPVVAYSGEIDKQRQAAENIEQKLKKLGLSSQFTHLIGPGLDHKFPPEWQKKTEEKLKEYIGSGKEHPLMPKAIDFTTYTLNQSDCAWASIRRLEKHYQLTNVKGTWDGKTFAVKTQNVRRLRLTNHEFPKPIPYPSVVTIDGQPITTQLPGETSPVPIKEFVKIDGKWSVATEERSTILEKTPGLQGPVDDAFHGSFICVVGTGKPLNPAMHSASLDQLERFKKEWDKYLRGNLKVVNDADLTREMINSSSIILFGDPGSNSVLSAMLSKLPLMWNKETVQIGQQSYDAATHLPVLIYPNPLNQQKYVVLNSGHTFHEAEFKGTNAQLYPRIGDFGIVKPLTNSKVLGAIEIVENGLFDEYWKTPRTK